MFGNHPSFGPSPEPREVPSEPVPSAAGSPSTHRPGCRPGQPEAGPRPIRKRAARETGTWSPAKHPVPISAVLIGTNTIIQSVFSIPGQHGLPKLTKQLGVEREGGDGDQRYRQEGSDKVAIVPIQFATVIFESASMQGFQYVVSKSLSTVSAYSRDGIYDKTLHTRNRA